MNSQRLLCSQKAGVKWSYLKLSDIQLILYTNNFKNYDFKLENLGFFALLEKIGTKKILNTKTKYV